MRWSDVFILDVFRLYTHFFYTLMDWMEANSKILKFSYCSSAFKSKILDDSIPYSAGLTKQCDDYLTLMDGSICSSNHSAPPVDLPRPTHDARLYFHFAALWTQPLSTPSIGALHPSMPRSRDVRGLLFHILLIQQLCTRTSELWRTFQFIDSEQLLVWSPLPHNRLLACWG